MNRQRQRQREVRRTQSVAPPLLLTAIFPFLFPFHFRSRLPFVTETFDVVVVCCVASKYMIYIYIHSLFLPCIFTVCLSRICRPPFPSLEPCKAASIHAGNVIHSDFFAPHFRANVLAHLLCIAVLRKIGRLSKDQCSVYQYSIVRCFLPEPSTSPLLPPS
jgi:hypothetical protein